jgi:hypothetical protein
MDYLIRGKLVLVGKLLGLPHEEFVEQIHSKVMPSLKMLVGDNVQGKVLAGGIPAGSRDVIFVVRLEAPKSHRSVHRFLASFPIFDWYEWDVTPLVTFEEWLEGF